MDTIHILAFVLFSSTGATVDIQPDYKFPTYEDFRRFAENDTREIILEKYSGMDIRVVPACKYLDRSTAMMILQKTGI